MNISRKKLASELSEWTDILLSGGLLAFAAVAIYVAFFVKNKWVKAAFLAWEILP